MEVPRPEESNGAIFLISGVEFLGCSEAKYAHSYGCDREKQAVDVRDKEGKKAQVSNHQSTLSQHDDCIHSQLPNCLLLISEGREGMTVTGMSVYADTHNGERERGTLPC